MDKQNEKASYWRAIILTVGAFWLTLGVLAGRELHVGAAARHLKREVAWVLIADKMMSPARHHYRRVDRPVDSMIAEAA